MVQSALVDGRMRKELSGGQGSIKWLGRYSRDNAFIVKSLGLYEDNVSKETHLETPAEVSKNTHKSLHV